MNIILAPDSFKGSLTAVEAVQAMEQGVRAALPEAELVRVPLADGGEGTVEALISATQGEIVQQQVTGPLGEPVEAFWGVLGDDVTGVIEMAAASGLVSVPSEKRNPLITTTYGTGELIAAALDRGCTKLIIGIGGSATNDGGAGMAQALGARLLDDQGKQIGLGGAALAELAQIDISHLDPRIAKTEVMIACDVKNPLVGPEGASAVYGPQKGATPEMVEQLDRALGHYAEVIERDLKKDVKDAPGAGAAGGLGAGLMAFLDAQPRLGIQLVLEATDFETYMESADLVISGEGKIDGQTVFGKAITGVARLAQKHGVPVIALTGAVSGELDELLEMGVSAVMGITSSPMDEQQAMSEASRLVQDATERVIRLLMVGRDLGDGRWTGG